jgi:hypothetical protein
MADKISIEIGLDGGDEVTRQLADIGKAGQKSFSDIQDAADQVNLSSTSAQFDDLGDKGQAAFNKVKSAAENAVVFEQVVQGVKKVEGAFESLGTAVTRMATRMTKSLGLFGVLARSFGPVGIAAGVAAGAIIKFGNDAAKSLSELTAEGAKLDLTAQQFDKLQKVLGQAGISTDAIAPGLAKLKESLAAGLVPSSVITVFSDFTTNLTNLTGITGALQRFIAQLQTMPDSVQRTQLAMSVLDNTLGAQVIAGLQTGTLNANNFASALGQIAPATQEQIIAAAKYEQALRQLNQAWAELKQSIAPIVTPVFGFLTEEIRKLKGDIAEIIAEFNVLKAAFNLFSAPAEQQAAAAQKVKEAWDQLGKAGQQAAQQTTQAANTTSQALQQTGQAGAQAAQGLGTASLAAGNLKSSADKLASASTPTQTLVLDVNNLALAYTRAAAAADAAAAKASYFANLPRPTSIPSLESQRPPRLAEGGLLGGRGTGTSDSNLAWVSRGEHIMPARTVAQPGMLALLEALRRSGGNLRGVLDGLGRFALGGLVPRSLPAFASGGPVGGMSHVTIQFPGLPPIGGLRASSAVIGELQKAAALAQVRSGGRKPSRYS